MLTNMLKRTKIHASCAVQSHCRFLVKLLEFDFNRNECLNLFGKKKNNKNLVYKHLFLTV